MEPMMLASAVVDCVAVGAIGWIVRRSAREREAALDDQRATLERLRADLAALVIDAERRARELESALEARERRLHAIVAESGRVEATRTPPPTRRVDPAEARLLRDFRP
jgi:predicted phage gp36 major capsid-like protein